MEKFDLFKQALNKKNEIKQELEEIQQRYISACVRVDELSNEITSDMGCEEDVDAYSMIKDVNHLLVAAADVGNVEMVKLCLDDGARDKRYAAIRYAAKKGHTDVVSQLIGAYKYPCPVLSKAMDLASSEGHFETCYMLNSYYLDRKIHDDESDTDDNLDLDDLDMS
jgi:hypothetical protein